MQNVEISAGFTFLIVHLSFRVPFFITPLMPCASCCVHCASCILNALPVLAGAVCLCRGLPAVVHCAFFIVHFSFYISSLPPRFVQDDPRGDRHVQRLDWGLHRDADTCVSAIEN